ncbi:MAG: hypothetical protein ACI83P_001154 [Janthinobacterium sp.]|jgi:hypothetical protein
MIKPNFSPKRLKLTLLIVVAAALLLFSSYTWITLNFSFSDGERVGYLQKFSKKGWICKTWEGEILLTSMPGAIPEKFPFSVRDEALASQLMAATGSRVVLTYSQHRGVPTSCFGETEYFIDAIKVTQ